MAFAAASSEMTARRQTTLPHTTRIMQQTARARRSIVSCPYWTRAWLAKYLAVTGCRITVHYTGRLKVVFLLQGTRQFQKPVISSGHHRLSDLSEGTSHRIEIYLCCWRYNDYALNLLIAGICWHTKVLAESTESEHLSWLFKSTRG